jgi:hypothetical protein
MSKAKLEFDLTDFDDKMEFERERLIDIKDPSFIDTFEKFIDYSKEENENDIKMINQLQAKLNLTYKNN